MLENNWVLSYHVILLFFIELEVYIKLLSYDYLIYEENNNMKMQNSN